MTSNKLPLQELKNNKITRLSLYGNYSFAPFHSHSNIDAHIGDEGAIKLSEALKSNTSLTSLDLSCNTFASVHSHPLKGIPLLLKEL
jgi:hypothetical protein